MALDAMHVHFEANDVLATSFAAMHVGKVSRRSMRSTLGAPNLNDSHPLRQGWGTFFLPGAIWIFVTSFGGRTKLST